MNAMSGLAGRIGDMADPIGDMPTFDYLGAQKAAEKQCLIDPRRSKYLRVWDAVIATCLIYTALLTPYEVAFLPPPATALAPLFIVNRCIDVLFLLDMIKEFLLMYEDTTGRALDQKMPTSTTDETKKGKKVKKVTSTYVSDHRLIARHYLLSWFAIDLVSVLTSLIDIISLASATEDGHQTSAEDLNKLRMLKILRVLRLIKLIRLLKSSRIFERWQAAIELDFSSQTVIKVLTLYLLCGHWFACILVLSSSFSYPMQSWQGAKGFCIDGADYVAADGELELPSGRLWERVPEGSQTMNQKYSAGDVGIYCVCPIELWIATYYWMIMLISGAAGGDTNCADIYPGEQLVFTVLVVLSALVSSQIIASFCDVLSNLNPEHSAFRQRVDNLNRYCRENRFDMSTRRRLREYLYRAKHVQVEESQRELLLLMSPKLQGELSLQATGSWLTTVRFLQHVEAECVVQVALALSPAVFVPTEKMSADYLYQLQRGTVISQGRVVVGHMHWGKECILERQDLRAKPAVALSYAEVSRIHRTQLIEIVHETAETTDGKYHYIKYPKALRKIKWEAVRLAVVRMLILMALQDSDSDAFSKRMSKGAWGTAMSRFGDELVSVEDIERQRRLEEGVPKKAFSKRATLSNIGKTIYYGKSLKSSPSDPPKVCDPPADFANPPALVNDLPPNVAAQATQPASKVVIADPKVPQCNGGIIPSSQCNRGIPGGSFAALAKGPSHLSVKLPDVSGAEASASVIPQDEPSCAITRNHSHRRRRVRRGESRRELGNDGLTDGNERREGRRRTDGSRASHSSRTPPDAPENEHPSILDL